MLKRVGVLGSDTTGLHAPEGVLIDAMAGGDVPSLTDALMTGDETADLAAAVEMAERHTGLLLLIAEAIDCREGLSPGTSRRVMEHAARFGEALKLEPADRIRLERSALLRGIGKFKVPNSVLLKDGLLTYDEWALIQDHPALGAELVSGSPDLAELAPVIRGYHECYDGTGYPDKLEGDAIPKLARIVRLLDVYCAMTSPRPYRTGAASKEDALDHLKNERGKHFDPELVDAFLDKNIADQQVPDTEP